MFVNELTREQLAELKQDYLIKLADEGSFAEVLGVDYDSPSYYDLINADSVVPDDVMFSNYDGVCFTDDDFFCTTN